MAPELLRLYDYDDSAPLDVKELKAEQKGGATVHDITYAGPKGRIDAYLMIPDGDGPFPGVLFMPGAPGARFTFFTEALALARRGIASLLPDPPYARPPIKGRRRLHAGRPRRDRAGGRGDGRAQLPASRRATRAVPSVWSTGHPSEPEGKRRSGRRGEQPEARRSYAAEHELNAQARAERDNWLARRLDAS